MFKNRHNIILLVLIVTFLTNQLLEKFGIYIYPLYCYLDDLLVVPITLGLYQCINLYILRKKDVGIQLPTIIICILGFSFHFELLMPLLSPKYTADIFDIVMYMAGGLFYALSFTHYKKTKASLNNRLALKTFPKNSL